MAEVIFRAEIKKRKIKYVDAASAGIFAQNSTAINPFSAACLQEMGLDHSKFKPRQLKHKMIESSYITVCMTEDQKELLNGFENVCSVRDIAGFDADASEALLRYSWPGNLRELKNTVKRATLLAPGRIIRKNDLGNAVLEATTGLPDDIMPLRDKKDEKERILQALEAAGGNKAKAARLLGIDRKTLYNKIKLYDIPQ